MKLIRDHTDKRKALFGLCLSVFLSNISFPLLAANNDEVIIALINVTLPGDDTTPTTLLIRDGTLDVITHDRINRDEVDITFDAQNARLVGSLELGIHANFLLLNNDVDTVQAMLDTRLYAQFAINNGQIVRNTLAVFDGETLEEKRALEQGWRSYTPPPRISQTTASSINQWNRFQTRYVNGIFAAALLLDRQRWLETDEDNLGQIDNLDDYSGGYIRGLRFGAVGTLNFEKPWIWTILAATHTFDKDFNVESSDNFSLFDFRLDIPVFETATLSLGKQKEPFSMERIMSLINLPQQERSSSEDAFLPNRNVGMVLAGNAFNNRVSMAGGLFNNVLERNQPASISDNSNEFVGRLTWVPFVSEDESIILHLGSGIRLSDLKEGASYSTTPEFNNAPDYLSVDRFEADGSNTWQYEVSLRTGPIWLHSEYIQTIVEAPDLNDPVLDGYNVTLSWIATGEMREYNKRNGTFREVPISRNVNQDGWGAWEYSVRYTSTDLNDGLINGGELDIWSLGVNWWLTDRMSLNLNYRYIDLTQNGFNTLSQGFNTRVVLILD